MAPSNDVAPDPNDSDASRLLSEIRSAYTKETFVAYWTGRLNEKESEILYAEILRNPELRNLMADMAQQWIEETEQQEPFDR